MVRERTSAILSMIVALCFAPLPTAQVNSHWKPFDPDRPPPSVDKLPLTLQDHHNPVHFRYIWIRELADVKNLFVTDGSCMASSACQNPSLTYMALTARVCDYAVGQIKRSEL